MITKPQRFFISGGVSPHEDLAKKLANIARNAHFSSEIKNILGWHSSRLSLRIPQGFTTTIPTDLRTHLAYSQMPGAVCAYASHHSLRQGRGDSSGWAPSVLAVWATQISGACSRYKDAMAGDSNM